MTCDKLIKKMQYPESLSLPPRLFPVLHQPWQHRAVMSHLKETGTTHWASPNPLTTNVSGWTGLPGGRRNDEGIFTSIGFVGYWWSATESSSTAAVDAMLYWDFTFLDSNDYKKTNGMSVRCVKD